MLVCKRERTNKEDLFAVAVYKEDVVVGHVSRLLSCIFSIFLRSGGAISCCITGTRQFSKDLPQGGLELPCVYSFRGPEGIASKARIRLAELELSPLVTVTIAEECVDHDEESVSGVIVVQENQVQDPPSPVTSTQHVSIWSKFKDIQLTMEDQKVITDGQKLTDTHINFAQRLIHRQYNHLNGLRLTLLQDKQVDERRKNYVQILHVQQNHWIVLASLDGKVLNVYNSLYTALDKHTVQVIQRTYGCSPCNIKVIPVQKQIGGTDCGLFAIAFSIALACSRDPSNEAYDQSRMREHILKCFSSQKIKPFP